MKKSATVVLLVLGLLLNGIIAIAAADRQVATFYETYRVAVLAIGCALLVLAVIVTWMTAVEEAERAGEILSSKDIFGAMLAGLVLCTVLGIVVGALTEWLMPVVLELAAHSPNSTWLTPFLRGEGAVGIACILIGGITGARLGYAYPDSLGFVTLAGIAFGAISGFAAAHIYEQAPALHIFAQFSVARPVEAAALLGASWGVFTGAFQLGHDRRKDRRNRREADEKLASSKDNGRAEIAIDAFNRAGFRVMSGTSATFATRLFDFIAKDSDDSVRTTAFEQFHAHPMLFWAFSGQNLRPPWNIIDRTGRLVRTINTLEALEAIAEEIDPRRTSIAQLT